MYAEKQLNSSKKKKHYNEDEDYSNLEIKEEAEPFKNLNAKLTNIASHISLKKDIKFLTEIVLVAIGENNQNEKSNENQNIALDENEINEKMKIDQEPKIFKTKVENALEEISIRYDPYRMLRKKIENKNSIFTEEEIKKMKKIIAIHDFSKLETLNFSFELDQARCSDEKKNEIIKEEPIQKFEKIIMKKERKKSM